MIALIPLGISVGIAVGFIMGKYHERIEWNKLIQAGKLPKPRQ